MKDKMKIYIAGPMSGYENFNFPSFERAEKYITTLGHTPMSPRLIPPLEHSSEACPGGDKFRAGGEGHLETCHLRGDILVLVKCDAIYMLQGWEASMGARLELTIAAHCGLAVFHEILLLVPSISYPTYATASESYEHNFSTNFTTDTYCNICGKTKDNHANKSEQRTGSIKD